MVGLLVEVGEIGTEKEIKTGGTTEEEVEINHGMYMLLLFDSLRGHIGGYVHVDVALSSNMVNIKYNLSYYRASLSCYPVTHTGCKPKLYTDITHYNTHNKLYNFNFLHNKASAL